MSSAVSALATSGLFGAPKIATVCLVRTVGSDSYWISRQLLRWWLAWKLRGSKLIAMSSLLQSGGPISGRPERMPLLESSVLIWVNKTYRLSPTYDRFRTNGEGSALKACNLEKEP